MRAALLAVALLALPALGAAFVREDVVVPLQSNLPATLASGTSGATSFGASPTSATTATVSLPLTGNLNVLKIVHGAASLDVKVRLASASGLGVLDNVVVATTDGTTTRNQVIVTLGSVTQTTGTALLLSSSGPDVSVLASGTVLGTASLQMRVQLLAPGTNVVLSEYAYTLGVT